MALFTGKIHDVYFVDPTNTIVEVVYNDEGRLIAHALEVDFASPDFQDLINEIPLEEIERKNQEKKNKIRADREKAFQAEVDRRMSKISQEKVEAGLSLSELIEKRNDMGYLFSLKVEIFKIEKVKASKKESVKKKIRASKDVFEIMGLLKQLL